MTAISTEEQTTLNSCLRETSLPAKKYSGKVRDTYDLKDRLLIVTTDRLSAFDRALTSIPFKGQVLNQTSLFWFKQTEHIIPNHIINSPDPNAVIVKKCQVFPVEFVVRGYITGTTNTSLWTHYHKGERQYCGHPLPEGLKKNQKLPQPILTPTTKAKDHDQPLSETEILSQGLMTAKDWEIASTAALELFNDGSNLAASRNLILVDTKYEFGKDKDGNILLVDEIHTPDSSRYWRESNYQERIDNNQEPDNFDKELIRLWYKNHCDPYNDEVLPTPPKENGRPSV